MTYKTFVRVVWVLGIVLVISMGYCVKNCASSHASAEAQVQTGTVVTQAYIPPAPVRAPDPEPPVRHVAPAAASGPLTASRMYSTDELAAKIEGFLSAHGKNRGRQQWVNCMPEEPFRATAVRFKEADAVKWSNDPDQWSQVRLDLDRDGRDDEKWLLKNGHTYKREVLGPDGKSVVKTEYVKR